MCKKCSTSVQIKFWNYDLLKDNGKFSKPMISSKSMTKILYAKNYWYFLHANFFMFILCGSRKYPYHPTDGSLVFTPHPLGISLPEGHLWTPPPPRNFHFFWRGFFFKLTAFLSLDKSENSSFIFTQPLLIICCTH